LFLVWHITFSSIAPSISFIDVCINWFWYKSDWTFKFKSLHPLLTKGAW
jgi:hypothetical protein